MFPKPLHADLRMRSTVYIYDYLVLYVYADPTSLLALDGSYFSPCPSISPPRAEPPPTAGTHTSRLQPHSLNFLVHLLLSPAAAGSLA
jgi:hypothetical protein